MVKSILRAGFLYTTDALKCEEEKMRGVEWGAERGKS